MKHLIIYDAKGEILRAVSCPQSQVSLQAQEGEFMLYVTAPVDASELYVKAGALLPRPKFSKLVQIDWLTATLKMLPLGTEVKVAGHTILTDDEHTELEFEVPGTYEVQLRKFPYLPEIREITVGE